MAYGTKTPIITNEIAALHCGFNKTGLTYLSTI